MENIQQEFVQKQGILENTPEYLKLHDLHNFYFFVH